MDLLDSAIQNANESGDVSSQLNTTLLKAWSQTNPVLKAEALEKVRERAMEQGFGLVARKARLMKSQAGRTPLLSSR